MNKHKKIAKRLIQKAVNEYISKFINEEDILNSDDKRKIIEEMFSILGELQDREEENEIRQSNR